MTGAAATELTLPMLSLLCRRWPLERENPLICLDSIASMDETRLSIISPPPPPEPLLLCRLGFLLISSTYSRRIGIPGVGGNKGGGNAGCTDGDAQGAAGSEDAAGLERSKLCLPLLLETLMLLTAELGEGGFWCVDAKRSFKERVESTTNPESTIEGPCVSAGVLFIRDRRR
jgi:hypothetical protein